MQYIFLVVAAAWACQFLMSYWQLRRFHRELAELRKRGRCSIGMYGNRWRGRIYGVLVVDEHDRVRHAALFQGWTVFSKLQPVAGLDGMRLEAILATTTPPANLRQSQWLALQHATQFLKTQPTAPQRSSSLSSIPDQQS